MKILDNRYSEIEAFGAIGIGDAFEWNERFYIKIPTMKMEERGSDIFTDFNAIDLEDGKPQAFEEYCDVKTLNAGLWIGEIG